MQNANMKRITCSDCDSPSATMGVVSGFARLVLVLINVAFLALGIALLVLGVLGAQANATFKHDDGDTEVIPKTAMIFTAAVGGLISFVSCLGCCGAWKNGEGAWRFALYLYGTLLSVAVLVQFIIAILLLGFASKLSNFPKGAPTDQWQKDFDKSINATYWECCVTAPNSTSCKAVQDTKVNDKGLCKYNYEEFREHAIDIISYLVGTSGRMLMGVAVVQALFVCVACWLGCRAAKRQQAA